MSNRLALLTIALTAGLVCPLGAGASELANPAGMLPPGRISIGASYLVGGYSITNYKLPCIMNRIDARIAYSPLEYLNFGIDLGTIQMDVDSLTLFQGGDTTHFGTFEGKYGFSGGAHIKGATPRVFHDMVALFGMVQASIFTSSNDQGAKYGGIDGAGALGLQFRVPKFGFLTVGAKMYYIDGTAQSYNNKSSISYSNTDNLQGWVAIDFMPTFNGQMKGRPYFSAEMTLVPGVSVGGPVPLEGISFSLAVGWVSPRLYGQDLEDVK